MAKTIYQAFTKEEIKDLESCLISVKLNLLTHGININYKESENNDNSFITKYGFKKDKSDIHRLFTLIGSKSLGDSKYKNLFPPILGIGSINLNKVDGHYIIKKEFYLGGIFSTKELLLKYLDVQEGDEWKIDAIKDEITVFTANEVLDLSRKLAKSIINKPFREIDIRNIKHEGEYYNAFPRLIHEFETVLTTQFNQSPIYTGSKIGLRKITKNLEETNLIDDLIKFHNFFKDI